MASSPLDFTKVLRPSTDFGSVTTDPWKAQDQDDAKKSAHVIRIGRRGRPKGSKNAPKSRQMRQPKGTQVTEDIDEQLEDIVEKNPHYYDDVFAIKWTSNKHIDLEWMAKEQNLAVYMHEDARDYYGGELTRLFNIDLQSRAEWERGAMRGLELADQAEDHSSTQMTNDLDDEDIGTERPPRFPMITQAVIEFVATAYPMLLADPMIVKVVTPSTPSGSANDPKAEDTDNRLSAFLSWQVMGADKAWKHHTDRLLAHVAACGMAWRKRWLDSATKKQVSTWLTGFNVVVNNNVPDLDRAPRITEMMSLYPHEVRQKVASGEFTDVEDLDTSTDWHGQIDFLEMHTWLDLDKDGQDEPYIITIQRDNQRIVRLITGFAAHGFQILDHGNIVFDQVKYFAPYFLVPAFDGTFYAKGFGHLIGRLNSTIDEIIAEIVEAARLNNANGGVIGGVGTGLPDSIDLRPNQLQIIPMMGNDLQSNLLWFPTKEPSQVLFTTLGLLNDTGKQLTSTIDLMSEGTPANMPATTAMAVVQQGTKLQTAIVKRLWQCMSDEFSMLYDLNKRSMTADTIRSYSYAGKKGEISAKDFADDRQVCVSADPEMTSDMHRMMLVQFYMQWIGKPGINQTKLMKRIFTLTRVPAPDELLDATPPAPDPEVQIKQQELQLKQQELKIKQMELVSVQMEREAKSKLITAQATEHLTIALENMMLIEQSASALPQLEARLRQAYDVLAQLLPEGSDGHALLRAGATAIPDASMGTGMGGNAGDQDAEGGDDQSPPGASGAMGGGQGNSSPPGGSPGAPKPPGPSGPPGTS